MGQNSHYHIESQSVVPPPGGSRVQFFLDQSDSYIKYGHTVFSGSSQRGDPDWTAEIISQTCYQAETSWVPISGTGFGGKFTGQGFDGIWLDMSDIFRPAWDGIHGREYISTQVDLGGGVQQLEFDRTSPQLTYLPPSITSFLPFLFHSVHLIKDHKEPVDWLLQTNPRALVSVRDSTPTDIDRVAVGSYYAGSPNFHLDGAHGGTGVAPEIPKKNTAMAIECTTLKVNRFLEEVGIRDEITSIASDGLRTAYDVAKAIALGADGAVIGTAELVAKGCIRVASCENGLGCRFGITTTDPDHAKKSTPMSAICKL